MNTTAREEVLTSLDNINESVDQSIMAVFCSIIQEYEKISVMMDNAEDDYFFYQEGQVWDTATGKGKIENGLFKLIAFIPRLFQGIINAITSVFKGKSEKDIDNSAKLAQNAIQSMNQNQLNEAANSLKETTEDNLGFDPTKKEFVLKRGLKHIRNVIFIVAGLCPVFKKILTRLKGGETSYDVWAKELADVLKGNKSLDGASFYLTVDALRDAAKDGYKASMGIRGLSSEISMMLEKKMREDFADGKNIEKQAEAKKVLDSISKGAKHVQHLTFCWNIIMKGLDLFGGKLYRKFKKGTLTEEDIELQKDITKAKELKKRLKALKQQEKTYKADKKTKDAKRLEILKLEEEIKKIEEKTGHATYHRDEAKNADERGDAMWNGKLDPNKKDSEKRHGFADSFDLKENWDTKDLTNSLKQQLDDDVPNIV